MARAVAYLRRSTPGEEDKNYSIENQLRDITAWAEREGHALVTSYSDPGGKSFTLNRPVLQAMLADARAGKFDILAVWKFDRLSRIQDQSTVVIYQLKQCNVRVVSITQPLPDGPVTNVLFSTYQFAAELELNAIRERTAGGQRARVHSNKLPAAPAPKYGYLYADTKKERYILDPIASKVVQRIFALFVSGQNLRKVRDTLNAEGVTTPSAHMASLGYGNRGISVTQTWRVETIYKTLVDTGYIGRLVGFEYKNEYVTVQHPITGLPYEQKRRVKRAEDDPARYVYPSEVCPPIVSEEMWQRAQGLLKLNKERASRNISKPQNLLLRNGIGRCGYCGRALSVTWNSRDTAHRYVCPMRSRDETQCPAPVAFSILSTILDEATWDWFVEKLSHPEPMQKFYERYLAKASLLKDQAVDEIVAIQAALEDAKRREINYLDTIGRIDDPYQRDEFSQRAKQAHDDYFRYQHMLQQMESRVVNFEREEDLVRSLQDMNEQARERLRNATNDEKRLTLYAYEVRVLLYQKDHTPPYDFKWMFDEELESS